MSTILCVCDRMNAKLCGEIYTLRENMKKENLLPIIAPICVIALSAPLVTTVVASFLLSFYTSSKSFTSSIFSQ